MYSQAEKRVKLMDKVIAEWKTKADNISLELNNSQKAGLGTQIIILLNFNVLRLFLTLCCFRFLNLKCTAHNDFASNFAMNQCLKI
jgi:hypothetical protein